MSTFIIVLVVILVLIYIGQGAFFKSKTNKKVSDTQSVQTAQPTQTTQLDQTTENETFSTESTLYIFKSTTCPACQLYNRENRPKVQNIVKELGLQIKEVDLDSSNPMDTTTKDVYDKCGIQYIPTACLVKSNGEIKQLGNGNGLNKKLIESAM